MFIVLTQPVDCIRLGPRAPAGMVTAVGDDLGAELAAQGQAAELTLTEFQERLLAEKGPMEKYTAGVRCPPAGAFKTDTEPRGFAC